MTELEKKHIRLLSDMLMKATMTYLQDHLEEIRAIDQMTYEIPNLLMSAHFTSVFNVMRHLASSNEEALKDVEKFIDEYSEHLKSFPSTTSMEKYIDNGEGKVH